MTFYWDAINVAIDVRDNGDMLIAETQEYVFGREHSNERYRCIPLDKVDDITDVTVAENDKIIPSQVGEENNQLWIKWQHELNPPESHTFVIKYRVIGGLHVNADTTQVYWKAIFGDRFKEYYLLAFTNSFLIFVPLYGWAKYAAMMGLLARLAYGDATGNPETVREAKRHIKPKTWLFFGAGLMETFIFYRKLFLASIPLYAVIIFIIRTASFNLLLYKSFWITLCILFLYYHCWLISHLFLYELPLAINNTSNVADARNESWQLIKKSVFQLQIITLSFSCLFVFSASVLQAIDNIVYGKLSYSTIASLIDFSLLSLFIFFLQTMFFCGSLFVPTLSLAISVLFNIIFNPIYSISSVSPLLLFQGTVIILLNIILGALFIPLWQSLKAVTYSSLKLPS